MNMRTMFLESPVIAAVKSDSLVKDVLKSDIKMVFVLYGSLLTIADIVARLKDAGKICIVHIDLIAGLAGKDVGVDFIHEITTADGIISTKQNLVRRAKEIGMIAGERSFIVDSMALGNTINHLKGSTPDFLEVMPGLLTDIISELKGYQVPLVAGGLIRDRKDISSALNAGACAISTTRKELWV